MYASQVADRMQVRFPEGLRQIVKVEAAKNNRSMNAEVVFRLQQAYEAIMKNEKSGTTA